MTFMIEFVVFPRGRLQPGFFEKVGFFGSSYGMRYGEAAVETSGAVRFSGEALTHFQEIGNMFTSVEMFRGRVSELHKNMGSELRKGLMYLPNHVYDTASAVRAFYDFDDVSHVVTLEETLMRAMQQYPQPIADVLCDMALFSASADELKRCAVSEFGLIRRLASEAVIRSALG